MFHRNTITAALTLASLALSGTARADSDKPMKTLPRGEILACKQADTSVRVTKIMIRNPGRGMKSTLLGGPGISLLDESSAQYAMDDEGTLSLGDLALGKVEDLARFKQFESRTWTSGCSYFPIVWAEDLEVRHEVRVTHRELGWSWIPCTFIFLPYIKKDAETRLSLTRGEQALDMSCDYLPSERKYDLLCK